MKNIYIKVFFFALIMVVAGCELEEIDNPNAPTVESFDEGASQADIQLLAAGIEAVIRNDLEFHYDTMSILAREYYDLSGVDPRYTGELLKGPLDNNGFLTTRAFAAWYKVVKGANVLLNAVENSEAGFSDADKNGYYGYANTMKAYALLMVLNRQYENGIRLDVADPDNLGPIVGYSEALTGIRAVLDEGFVNLANSGDAFDYDLSAGFDNFDTPSSFAQFNRAIAVRVALYQGNLAEVRTLLNGSFFDLNGDLNLGVAHVFGLTGNDIPNAQFHVPNQSGQEFMIHDSWVADSEAGDTRVDEKSILFETGTVMFDNLSADYQIAVYDSNVDPVFMIRNEELILIYAEAQVDNDPAMAVAAINRIRNEAGLSDYDGPTDATSLIEEILNQRRYSLLAEGHRLVDLRRLGRLNETYVPLDRDGDNILDSFPTPFNEGL
ncbi:MAG: RagB/SusD family nutrient uptake outer membrane protein [Bacteroidia bacterium]|nr:RagB/SusD family nutrient uptake outer membrane protein [Bacteroidia bacterium]NNF30760.1 RagB/SusD family nutrient uptake outer membrane protein [Flavobacteriaceae bacterium]MBT8277195.1 RagB/SusD family nutrient uptake outer membrane protein [Bacteroidia bacterium]NNJ81446.1 RagB/SusD family nutrient uptake outer membrane protein [Flavobacteriaceae bacterium]NNK54772.1 RagB/SusD family nutrient uptake outer membrane protein [Flavobacteriaceae bacterium]